MRGNVVDMAIGIVIGLAFAALVTALVVDILTPITGHGDSLSPEGARQPQRPKKEDVPAGAPAP